MKQLFFYLTISLFVLQACDKDDLCLRGSGTVNEYDIEVSEFDRVALMGPVNLKIKQGATQKVDVLAEQEIYGPMSWKVNNKLFEIGYEDNITCFETAYGAWVNVTVPNIYEVHVDGVSEIESDGDLDLARLGIDISGTAEIALSGVVAEQVIESSGVVTTQNFDLITENTTIEISGSGDLEVNCTGKLTIKVSGSATIKYKGNPQITQDVSGSLSLINSN